LRTLGLKILAVNYRCPVGEADLIALDRRDSAETIVVVEVKTRSSDRYTNPESAVNPDKQRRLRNVARHYLAERETGNLDVRFDVVSVLLRPRGPAEIRHIPGAF
jgi:putative endonuclease